MCTIGGKKYEKSLGNLSKASESEAGNLQRIFALKEKIKEMHSEIEKRAESVSRDKAVIVEVLTSDGEKKMMTCLSEVPTWIRVPVPKINVAMTKTTIPDTKDFLLNS